MPWPSRFTLPLLVACSLPAAAMAQTATGKVALDQYQPTPFSDRILRADGSGVLPFGQYRLGIDVDYALRPLVLIDAAPGIFQAGTPGPNHNVVEHAAGAALLASFGLSHRLEAGLVVPLTLFQSGEILQDAVKPSTTGVGNVRLGVKGRFVDWRGLGAGAAILATVPGGVGTLTHESAFGAEGRLFADYHRGRMTLATRAGYRLRSQIAFYDVSIGNELTFAAGATWRLAARTTVMTEIAGGTAAGRPFADLKQSPVEALAGLRQRVGKTWFTLSAGPGLTDGYGSPMFRVVAGFTWANLPPDADGDGVPDDDDRCPTDPEDRDGFEDADGCPDPDNDKDGIPDVSDKCPNDPEDKDGFEDADGCPDPDNDKDGIPDVSDKCPAEPETVNDFEDEDGCPDEKPPASDRDKDGIPDDTDECPEEPEDKDGFEDEDGCPDPDNDKDGIPDVSDKCPLEPETINGIDDDDGCPDKGQAQVRLGKNQIETLQPIYFDTDRSRVRHAFYNILGQIASLLKAHPEIGRCAIEGHTDDTGPPEWNQKLSVLRAEAVIEFLANKGVDPKRLVPIGHGEHLPWASNQTPWGRAKNRRVVFHIEGVNAEDEKKQEVRQERRRRIRHQREREQQKAAGSSDHGAKSGSEQAPVEGPTLPAPSDRKQPAKTGPNPPAVVPASGESKPATRAPTKPTAAPLQNESKPTQKPAATPALAPALAPASTTGESKPNRRNPPPSPPRPGPPPGRCLRLSLDRRKSQAPRWSPTSATPFPPRGRSESQMPHPPANGRENRRRMRPWGHPRRCVNS